MINAQLILTGHSLTLFLNNQPALQIEATETEMERMKRFITHNRWDLSFTDDCYVTFPWLRDAMFPTMKQHEACAFPKGRI